MLANHEAITHILTSMKRLKGLPNYALQYTPRDECKCSPPPG